MLCACTPNEPTAEALRSVRTVELHYDKARETDRYFGSVGARYEVDQAFRVGGKVVSRKVDVGQKVRHGDVIAVLDPTDYKLAVEAAQQQLAAAEAQARQAQSDRQRLDALKSDGSVSPSDDEKAQSNAQTTRATAQAKARELELARNRLEYTTLRASQDGVVTSVKFEVGQVVAEGLADRLDRQRRRARDRRRRAGGSLGGIQGVALSRHGSQARPSKHSTSCCGNSRRRRRRKREPSAPA